MRSKDKVLYNNEIFEVIFKYNNGKLEIRHESQEHQVLLVQEEEVSLLSKMDKQTAS
ncbi:hypothetical protein SM124_07105 [Bacillus sp. 31A1R]|uniref:Uncharacterized protein n=1 Tax=Robertmurraya mangrovi TaxID=3098077 RepID=A0ABU5IWG8_9BACI|nr:hypothetical protein [Bacillus sp. 31A1R]MDZ5471513.1 hypothetical protein [Bacillus sp. 31A1R]